MNSVRDLVKQTNWGMFAPVVAFYKALINVENLPSVVAVAIRYDDEQIIHSLPRPARHHNVLHKLAEHGYKQARPDEQGFLLSDGTYADREHALKCAISNRQLLPRHDPRWKKLYSESVW